MALLQLSHRIGTSIVAWGALLVLQAPMAAVGQDVVWLRAIETSNTSEAVMDVEANATGVHVCGWTEGALTGQTSAGSFDAWVRKFDLDGGVLWTRQFGTVSADRANGVAVGPTGVYVTGWVQAALPGQTHLGSIDAFVRKYDFDGTELWTRQFGTAAADRALAVVVDASGAYVSGRTEGALPGQVSEGGADVFVRKYDSGGTELWTRQFGTPGLDAAYAVEIRACELYVGGDVEGALPGQTSVGGTDGFLRRYDCDGAEVWTRQFGTSGSNTELRGLAVDPSMGIFVAGRVYDPSPGGARGAYARRYDPDGTDLWTTPIAASSVQGVATGAGAGVYVAGWEPAEGPGSNVLLLNFSFGGSERWSDNLEAVIPNGIARGISVFGGALYLGGRAPEIDFPGEPDSGGFAARLVDARPVPTISPFALAFVGAAFAATAGLALRRRAR